MLSGADVTVRQHQGKATEVGGGRPLGVTPGPGEPSTLCSWGPCAFCIAAVWPKLVPQSPKARMCVYVCVSLENYFIS